MISDSKLVGRDQSEISQLRRMLGRLKADHLKNVVGKILSKSGHHALKPDHPEWEIGVYPLYYYPSFWQENKKTSSIYDGIWRKFLEFFPGAQGVFAELELRDYLTVIANSEIDLLIDDVGYFIFVEAKACRPGQKATFRTIKGVHQLVRQFVQGKLLAKIVNKTFILATLLIKDLGRIEVKPSNTDQMLLRAIGEEKLQFIDVPWQILDCERSAP